MNQGINLDTKHLLCDFFLGERKEHLLSLDRVPMTESHTGLSWWTMSLLRLLPEIWMRSYLQKSGWPPKTAASLKKSHLSMEDAVMKTAKRSLSFKDPAALCLLYHLLRPHDSGAGFHSSGRGTEEHSGCDLRWGSCDPAHSILLRELNLIRVSRLTFALLDDGPQEERVNQLHMFSLAWVTLFTQKLASSQKVCLWGFKSGSTLQKA